MTEKTGYWANLKNVLKTEFKKNRSGGDSVAAREDTMALGILGTICAVIGVVGMAIAMPIVYGTGVPSYIGMAIFGGISGGIGGFATPFIINKVCSVGMSVCKSALSVINPANYKKAWSLTKGVEKQATVKATSQPASKAVKKSKQVSAAKKGFNATANDNAQKPVKVASAKKTNNKAPKHG